MSGRIDMRRLPVLNQMVSAIGGYPETIDNALTL